MSDLEFFDVMRMFMGEMLNRGYNMDERQIILQNVSLLMCSLLSPARNTHTDTLSVHRSLENMLARSGTRRQGQQPFCRRRICGWW